jgi:hypothetical protein
LKSHLQVLALKCTITDKPQPVDAALAPALETFLLRMQDDDRVRYASLSPRSSRGFAGRPK